MSKPKHQSEHIICHYCRQPIGSPGIYRVYIDDCPGGRWIVCGPQCPNLPDDVIVFPERRLVEVADG